MKDKLVIHEDDVHEAIQIILMDSLNYAINYCRAAQGMNEEELRVQCLYILNNIIGWRHPEAKRVRQVLKEFARQK